MKILMILPYVPYPLRRGTYQRVFHLAKELGSRNVVDLFCLSTDKNDADLKSVFKDFINRLHFSPFQHQSWPSFLKDRIWHSLPVTVRHWWSESVLSELRSFSSEKEYDLIYFCDLVLWPYIRTCFFSHKKCVLDRSRVDWLFQKEELDTLPENLAGKIKRWENLLKIQKLEREVIKKVALEIVCGENDKLFLEKRLGRRRNIFVLPNGTNTLFFDYQTHPPHPTAHSSALFCGALDYIPNIDGLQWYIETIHRGILDDIPDYRLTIIGKNPGNMAKKYHHIPGIDFVGEVEDVRPYYQDAWFQIIPLRIGGGTRLKITEGLSMKNPVISTSIGAQGLKLEHEKHLLIADNPGSFILGCKRYIRDASLRQRLAECGCNTICKEYSWGILGKQLQERLELL